MGRLLGWLIGRGGHVLPRAESVRGRVKADGEFVDSGGSAGTTETAPMPLGDADGRADPPPTDPGDESMPGAVHHYRLVTRVGAGGMGVVYKAEDTRLGRLVALKFLSGSAVGDRYALQRFWLEARAASALNHPNICTVHDIGEGEAGTFIVMEFLEGQSLRTLLRRGPLPVQTLLRLGIQLADALEAAHARGIVHRDIKPENLFVVAHDRLKVLDFGVAKLQASEDRQVAAEATTRTGTDALTQPGTAIGTSPYMSPEQVRGEGIDARSDLFSVGAVLFEMATRRRAFEGGNAADTYAAVLTREPVLPPSETPIIRAALQRIIGKAVEKDRELRYQHAADLATDLKRLLRDIRDGRLGQDRAPLRGTRAFGASLGKRLGADLARAGAVAALVLLTHGLLETRASGRYLEQFQLAFIQENLARGGIAESDFEAGGRYLPLIVDISALHPDKRRPTDRALLDVVVEELRRHGARAIGIDLSFDDLQGTDFRYFQKWVDHGNVRVGIYRRAVEKREAWLGRPEFAALAAGIALPPDNPQHAFAFSRRWFPAPPSTDLDRERATDCGASDAGQHCKEDLIQLPVALWFMSEKQRVSSEMVASTAPLEFRLRRLLDEGQRRTADPVAGSPLDFGTFVIDYSYLKELRRDVLALPTAPHADQSSAVVAHLRAHSARIADRLVLVGDLEDTSDQVCYTQGMKPLPGVLVHACSLATLNRGTLLQATGSLDRRGAWALAAVIVAVIIGLRVAHTFSSPFRELPFEYFEIIVFSLLALVVVLACRWVARTHGIVWPHFVWVSGGLALYAVATPVVRACAATPGILHAALRPLRAGARRAS